LSNVRLFFGKRFTTLAVIMFGLGQTVVSRLVVNWLESTFILATTPVLYTVGL
jgi:hypothetical protein